MRVLHVAAELFPLIKTGGLADVTAALPPALLAEGLDVRVLLPGLPAVLAGVTVRDTVCSCGPAFGAGRVHLRLAQLPHSAVLAYVIDAPFLYDRPGSPYQAPAGSGWADNLQRFALLGWVGAQLAAGALDPGWSPQVLHAHDWHAGLAPAYLAARPGPRPLTVYTVHNLAYQGTFDGTLFAELGLPPAFFAIDGLEFHGQVSFMKAGLRYADRITTVSPTYAREIATAEFGWGLDGVIRSRSAHLSGVLNGVDAALWDPAHDAALAAPYDRNDLSGKAACKAHLQQALGLEAAPHRPLFAVVSRLSEQKGLDLVLHGLDALLAQGAQFVLLGSGDGWLELGFAAAAAARPGSVAVRLGFDEALSHRIMAGADVLVVPSRFEPCGLTQLYALRYGTLPLVRQTGGLADTVVDATADHRASGRATGFVFGPATVADWLAAAQRAIALFHDQPAWHAMMRSAMDQHFGWPHAARQYASLYRTALEDTAGQTE